MTWYPYYKPDGTGLTEEDILRNFNAYLGGRGVTDPKELAEADSIRYDTMLAEWIDKNTKAKNLFVTNPRPTEQPWEWSTWIDGQQVVYKIETTHVLTRTVLGCKHGAQIVAYSRDPAELKAEAHTDSQMGF